MHALIVLVSALASPLPPNTAPEMMSIQLQPGDNTTTGLDLIEDAGFGMMRKGVYWSSVETVKGVYNFAAYDALFADAKANGQYISATLYGNNKLYETYTSPGITTAAGRAGFAKFAAAAAAHFKNDNVIWEIWNEPNLTSFWHTPSNSNVIADEYTLLVKAVVPAIKKADPASFVVVGSISALWSQSFSWFDECVAKGILTTGIDGISLHPYGFSYPELALDQGYNIIRDTLDEHNASDLRLVVSEVGYPTGWIEERQGYTSAQAVNVQGWMFVRQHVVDQIADMGYSNWYEFRETASWGLVDAAFKPKPAYAMVKEYAAQLTGYSYVKTLAPTSTTDYVALFENDAGQQKLVVWTTLSTAHAITVPVGVSGTAKVSDINGATVNKTVTGNNLAMAVSRSPQYVLLPVPPKAANLALGKSVTASSGTSSAHLLTDGVVTTNSRWMSDAGYPQSVVVDLKGTFTIDEVKYMQHAERTDNWRVEVLQGTTWKIVASGTANTLPTIDAKIASVKGSKVRFTVLTGSLYQKVYELEVLGH